MQISNMPSGMLGVNTYFVADEEAKKAFLVDPGGWSPEMKAHVLSSGAELAAVILTHGHADHIMGVPAVLADFPGVEVVAHEQERDMLSDTGFNMSERFGSPTVVEPDRCVREGDTMTIGGMELTFLFTPGHTPGGLCIYMEKEGVLFSGDTLFQASIGRTDFPGASFPVLAESIHNKLWSLPDDTRVLPGHMGPTTIGFEKEHNPFV